MSRLISCDGVARDSDAVGRVVIVPQQVERAPSRRWEVAAAIYEFDRLDGEVMTYRESYWEVPRLGWRLDHRGRAHRFDPEPGVYYYPESAARPT